MEPTAAKWKVVNELHKATRKNFPRRKTIIRSYKDCWQVDLGDFQKYANENNGYRYLLVCINCYSKFVYTEPIKSKTAANVCDAMEKIIKTAKYTPVHLNSDRGTEFWNQQMKKLLKKYKINHYSTFSTKKAAIVERVIRTLKSRLYREFSARGSYRWINLLQPITNAYNHTVHRTIGMRPIDVSPKTRLNVYDYLKVVPKTFKYRVGDVVRISKYKSVFEKGYTPGWSTELFIITKAKITNPPTYLLKAIDGQPIKGCFYEAELQKTQSPDTYLVEKIIRKRRKNSIEQIYVKWLGFSEKHNSWINATDIV